MIDVVARVGDLVSLTIPKENREWGYDPCPDGTIAEIVSFGTIHYGYTNNFGQVPGIYHNRSWVDVRLPDGKMEHISICFLDLADQEDYQRRREAHFTGMRSDPDYWHNCKDRIGDLPETACWVGDVVKCFTVPEYNRMRIQTVKYDLIGQKRIDGSPMPIYDVTCIGRGGWWVAAGDDEITLLERGNVWKYHHQEPTSFTSLEEEASFFSSLGHTRDVRNPANDLYKWTKDEVLDALEKGLAHGFSVSNIPFSETLHHSAIRFRDEELGKRVAAHTLRGFGRLP